MASVCPRVTVVVPCFNVADYLPSALEQLWAQSVQDIEIMIIDDGSTDDTAQIARAAAARDARVRVIQLERNSGVAVARKSAVDAASAPWIWFVDADDSWPEHALEALERNAGERTDVVVAGARYVYQDGRTVAIEPPAPGTLSGERAFISLLQGRIKGHLWNKLFRTSLLRQLEFVPSRVHSDLSLVAEALSASREVIVTREHVYDYRVRSGSIITSRTPRADSLRTVDAVVQRSASRFSASKDLSRDMLYFRHRFILLSALKDASNRSYSAPERVQLVKIVRRDMRWRAVGEFLRRSDPKRALAVFAAKTSSLSATAAARLLGGR